MPRPKNLTQITCLTCGVVFSLPAGDAQRGRGRKYCSRPCAQKPNRGISVGVKHGMTATPVYKAWAAMRQRCLNPKNPQYPNYGGRGIRICERWVEFDNFFKDMGVPPTGMSIDRYPDNDGNYEPGNCRWATKREQASNMRRNRTATLKGRTQTQSEWAREYGMKLSTLRARLQKGESLESALTRPLAGETRVTVTCSECGLVFGRVPSRIRVKLEESTCSRSCSNKRRWRLSPPPLVTRVVRACRYCRTEITVTPCRLRKSGNNFCSMKCIWAFHVGDEHPTRKQKNAMLSEVIV